MATRHPDPSPHHDQEAHRQHLRWFFALLLVLWIIAAMTVTVVVFCLTRNPLSFSLFSTLAPPVYLSYRLAKWLLPMSKREYKLKALKLTRATPQQQSRKREGQHSQNPIESFSRKEYLRGTRSRRRLVTGVPPLPKMTGVPTQERKSGS